jgi:hypothetical protein
MSFMTGSKFELTVLWVDSTPSRGNYANYSYSHLLLDNFLLEFKIWSSLHRIVGQLKYLKYLANLADLAKLSLETAVTNENS